MACGKRVTSYEFATEDPALVPLVLALDPGQRETLEAFLRTLGRQQNTELTGAPRPVQ